MAVHSCHGRHLVASRSVATRAVLKHIAEVFQEWRRSPAKVTIRMERHGGVGAHEFNVVVHHGVVGAGRPVTKSGGGKQPEREKVAVATGETGGATGEVGVEPRGPLPTRHPCVRHCKDTG